jgi:hypothetical protein
MLSFQHGDLQRLHAYWLERCTGVPLPARDNIDPIDLGWMLDRISLFECHEEPLRFRCRVAGTWYSLRFDFEANGSWLHDWPDSAMRDSALSLYRLIHADGRPRRLIRHFTVDGVTSMYEGAALPLAAHHGETGVAMILVGAAPIENPDFTGLSLIFEAGSYRNWSS